MCENPITIINKTKSFVDNITNLQPSVPCGVCPSCLEDKHQEILLRALFEYNNVVGDVVVHPLTGELLAQGFVLFPTFTYDDKHLPMLDTIHDLLYVGTPSTSVRLKLKKSPYPKGCVPVFEKTDFLGKDPGCFQRKLRDYCLYHHNITGIKFLFACEYGDTPGFSHRSHVHSLIFVPTPKRRISDDPAMYESESVEDYYKRLTESDYVNDIIEAVKSLWQPHGNVEYSEEGALVSSHHAISYVCSYVGKDVGAYTKQYPELDKYLHKPKFSREACIAYHKKHKLAVVLPKSLKGASDSDYMAIYDVIVSDWRRQHDYVKYSLPFSHWSSGFGASMADYIRSLSDDEIFDILNNGYKLPPQLSITGALVQKSVNVPRYIYNKFFYDREKVGTVLMPSHEDSDKLVPIPKYIYKPTTQAARFVTRLVSSRLSDLEKKFRFRCMSLNLYSAIDNEVLTKLNTDSSQFAIIDRLLGIVNTYGIERVIYYNFLSSSYSYNPVTSDFINFFLHVNTPVLTSYVKNLIVQRKLQVRITGTPDEAAVIASKEQLSNYYKFEIPDLTWFWEVMSAIDSCSQAKNLQKLIDIRRDVRALKYRERCSRLGLAVV